MNLSVIVFGIIYPVIALLACQLWAGHWAWHLAEVDRSYRYDNGSHSREPYIPKADAWFLGYIFGILIGAIWPVIVITYITKVKLPAVGAEKRGKLKVHEHRIKELERQLDIR